MFVSKEELISTYVIFTRDREFFKQNRVVGRVVKIKQRYYFVAKSATESASYIWNTNLDEIHRVVITDND